LNVGKKGKGPYMKKGMMEPFQTREMERTLKKGE